MTPRIGSLFSGAGGLDLAVEQVFGGDTVWHSEVDPAASKVLAHRWPGVPNHEDITQIDWAAVEPIDILCGGFPCQDLSAAGKRAGIKTGTRSGLWSYYAEAIDTLRPKHVVIENVRGLLSGRAHRDMERCDPIVGDNPDGFVLRAAGAVLGDLADIGYDTCWATVSAASVGAPHRRERVFILATSADTGSTGSRPDARRDGPEIDNAVRVQPGRRGHQGLPFTPPTDANCAGGEAFSGRPRPGNGGRLQPVECGSQDRAGRPVDLLPTPNAQDGNGGKQRSREALARGDRQTNLTDLPRLLLTPTSRDHKEVRTKRQDDTCLHGALLPTPRKSDGDGGANPLSREERMDDVETRIIRIGGQWGKYGTAVARWETVLGRPAPNPTEPNSKGNPRLNPEFSSWMMGWPEGWVTDVPGISRNDQLRIVGNGVVDRQAVAALRYLLAVCSNENPGACSEQARDTTD